MPALWRRLDRRRHRSTWGKLGVPILAAAALVAGIGIGRWSRSETPIAPVKVGHVAVATAWTPTYTDLRWRAHGLLQDVVNADLGSAARWQPLATELLWATRRLIDSPIAVESDQMRLLGELELVLAELLGLDPTDPTPDLELLRATIRDNELMRQLSSDREGNAT